MSQAGRPLPTRFSEGPIYLMCACGKDGYYVGTSPWTTLYKHNNQLKFNTPGPGVHTTYYDSIAYKPTPQMAYLRGNPGAGPVGVLPRRKTLGCTASIGRLEAARHAGSEPAATARVTASGTTTTARAKGRSKPNTLAPRTECRRRPARR